MACPDVASDRAPRMHLQVQEGALDWLLSVLSATVMHIGPQLLPYKQRLKALLGAFFALPSKVSLHQQQSVPVCLDLANLHMNLQMRAIATTSVAARQVLRRQCMPSELQTSLAHTMSSLQTLAGAVLGSLAPCVLPEGTVWVGGTNVLCCCCGPRRTWTCASWTSCAVTCSSSLPGCCSPCMQHWLTKEGLAYRTCTCAPLGCWDPFFQRWSPGILWTSLRPWRSRQQAPQMAVLQLCTWSRGSWAHPWKRLRSGMRPGGTSPVRRYILASWPCWCIKSCIQYVRILHPKELR